MTLFFDDENLDVCLRCGVRIKRVGGTWVHYFRDNLHCEPERVKGKTVEAMPWGQGGILPVTDERGGAR